MNTLPSLSLAPHRMERHIIDSIIFLSFFSSILLDPSNQFLKIKYQVFLLVILWALTQKKTILEPIPRSTVTFVLLNITIAFQLILSGILNGANIFSMSTDALPALLFPALLLFIDADRNRFIKYFYIGLIILLVFEWLLFINRLVYRIPLIDWYATQGKDSMYYGIRDWGPLRLPMIYIKSCPLLIFLLGRWGEKKRYLILSIIALLTIIITGTRTNIIAAFLLFLLIIKKRDRLLFKIASCGAAVIMVILWPKIWSFLGSTFFAADDFSGNIKYQHLTSYLNLFRDKPSILLFGQGIGVPFFSQARGMTTNTELTYLEMVRRLGIPMAFTYFLFLLLPIRKMDKKAIAPYLLYLIIAGSNPLLFSSTGMLAVVYAYLSRQATTAQNNSTTQQKNQ